MYPQLLPERADGHLRTMGVAASLWVLERGFEGNVDDLGLFDAQNGDPRVFSHLNKNRLGGRVLLRR